MGGYFAWKRKPGQKLYIEGGIEIKLGKLKDNEAQILILAPGLKITVPTKELDGLDRAAWMLMQEAEKNAAQ